MNGYLVKLDSTAEQRTVTPGWTTIPRVVENAREAIVELARVWEEQA